MTFALAFLLGVGIITATGIPATGGIANIFVAVMLIVVGMQIVPKFGFATLTAALIFTYAIPTVIGGPPGVHKVLNGILIGLVADIVAVAFGRGRLAYMFAGMFGAITSILSIYAVLVILNLPGVAKLKPLLLPLTGVQAVLGLLAGLAGYALFQRRLKKLAAVQRLMT